MKYCSILLQDFKKEDSKPGDKTNNYFIIEGVTSDENPMHVILLALEVFVNAKRNKIDDLAFQNYISYSFEKKFPKITITFLNRLTPEETPTQWKTLGLRPRGKLDRSEKQREFVSRRIRNAHSAIPLFFYFVDLFADSVTLHNISITRVLDVLLTVIKGKARPSLISQ
jgi:hypothetical protein